MFIKAVPVWKNVDDYKEKLNTHLIFRENAQSLTGCSLKIAAADWYKLYVNGEYVGSGPARSAVGYGRVDEYDLSVYDKGTGDNEIVIYAAGFYCKTLTSVWQESYLCAELVCDDDVIKYTGRDFECFANERRVRKVERFSVQRYFQEIWDCSLPEVGEAIEVRETARDIKFIPRRVPKAYSEILDFARVSKVGTFAVDENKDVWKNGYSFDPHSEPQWGAFHDDEIELKPFRYINSLGLGIDSCDVSMPVTLGEGQWLMVDMGRINAGFVRWSGRANADSDVIVALSEVISGDVFEFAMINMQPASEYTIPCGQVMSEESFEPYTCRYVAVFVKKGSITIDGVGIRTFERDITSVKRPKFTNPDYAKLYEAALRTFSHNAADIFMDCPSRERSGWLCDSYFTAKAEYFFYGENPVEDTFLENFVLYKNRGEFPQGVLPMCYPSDPHQNNKFITQWDMWYVLEVCDYLTNRKPAWDKSVFEPTVFGVVNFLSKYENDMGLLENLPSWNFIEWSSANEWVKDINFPTNMLYAGMLESVAKVFGKDDLAIKADAIRERVVEMSFDGEFFIDNALKNPDGTYTRTKNMSEACQYYTLLFGGICMDDEKYFVLMNHVREGFGEFDSGDREFCPINAFIGLYLRMNLLDRIGDASLTEKCVKEFFLKMCDTTGTLWECREPHGSLDHGFASYAATVLPQAN